jgi:hypothetical protein
VPSPTPIDLSASPLNPPKGSVRAETKKADVQPELYGLLSSPPVPQRLLSFSHAKIVVKATNNGVRGGVIIDSDDDLQEVTFAKSVPRPGLKRKSSELSEVDEDVPSPEPPRKKLRMERTDPGMKTKTNPAKKGVLKNVTMQSTRQKPLALSGTSKVKEPIPAKGPTVATIPSKPRKSMPPEAPPRIKGMRTKDGTRLIAASTPLRCGRPIRADLPRGVQELSQKPTKEIPTEKVSLQPRIIHGSVRKPKFSFPASHPPTSQGK